jgi:hypothetical protein
MLIYSSNLEQFDQKVNEKLAWLHHGWFEGSYETNKCTQNKTQIAPNGVKLNSKPTLKDKRNRTKKKHKKGGHMQIKTTWLAQKN